MIKVNLVGSAKKKPVKARTNIAVPTSITPILIILIVLASAAAGYSWYSSLTHQAADLDNQIRALEARKASLDAVIKQDQAYEARKKMVETRVKVIEGLQKNQVSPVLVLDQLGDAVQRTQFVWLSNLDQKDAVLNMSGTGTSLNAIADFYSNLLATGYFKNIDLGSTQESAGNFTFSLKCEFAPPRNVAANATPTPQPAIAGGN
jgi:Tfp pilus assembly protein PilN